MVDMYVIEKEYAPLDDAAEWQDPLEEEENEEEEKEEEINEC